MVFVVCAHRPPGGWRIADTRARMDVGARPSSHGARLLGERIPLRATALLLHRTTVPSSRALRCTVRIRDGRPSPRSFPNRPAGALMPCAMCGDSLGQVSEKGIDHAKALQRPVSKVKF